MEDELACNCHGIHTDDEDEKRVPSVASLLDNRSHERYVPSAVTCARCGASGDEFDWFQRVPAGAVDGDRPARELYFCDIVCTSWYCSANFADYDPDLLGTRVSY